MTQPHLSIKTIAIFVAAYTGFTLHAEACPKHKTVATESVERATPRFVIAGLVDVNSDEKTDLELIRRLIKQNGGVIDAELRIDGKVSGELRPDTTHIILGEQPDKTEVSPRVTKQFDVFILRAAKLNIHVLHADKLLEFGTRRTPPDNDAGAPFRPRRPTRNARGAY